MKNFVFKSRDQDLQKIVPILVTKLELLNKNVIYVTYQVDKILKIEQSNMINKGLQKQVDEYFEDETSPQTDSEEQWVSLDLLSEQALELLVNTYTKAYANKNESLTTLIEELVCTIVELLEALNMALPVDKSLVVDYH